MVHIGTIRAVFGVKGQQRPLPPAHLRSLAGASPEPPEGLQGYEGTVRDAIPPITPRIARIVPICTMEDIGMKDGLAGAQPIFFLSGIPKGMGVSSENSEMPACPPQPGGLAPRSTHIRLRCRLAS